MYGRIACFLVRIRAGINFLMSITKSMNLILACTSGHISKDCEFLFLLSSAFIFFLPQKHGLQHNWDIIFQFGLYRGVDVRTVTRSRIDGLPHFLINGAPCARSSTIKNWTFMTVVYDFLMIIRDHVGWSLTGNRKQRIYQLSCLKSGHGRLPNFSSGCLRQSFIQSGHLQEAVAYEKWSLWESRLYFIWKCSYRLIFFLISPTSCGTRVV